MGELQRLEQDLAALDVELGRAEQELDRARRINKVSRARYDELRRELDQLRFEEDAARLSKAPDAEKQKKLAQLQKRKEGLIEAIRTWADGGLLIGGVWTPIPAPNAYTPERLWWPPPT